MDLTSAEADSEYEALLKTNISPEMASQTDIMNLMRGKAKNVFMPKEWNGISGVEIDLEFDTKLKPFSPKSIFVNDKLY